MPDTPTIRNTAATGGAIALLARIVHRDGRLLRPADVAAVQFSLVEIADGHPGEIAAIVAPEQIHGDEVFSDTLQIDHWSVDAIGYNFRHKIELSNLTPQLGGHYEARFLITLSPDENCTLRFRLKAV